MLVPHHQKSRPHRPRTRSLDQPLEAALNAFAVHSKDESRSTINNQDNRTYTVDLTDPI
jgi:hypothetical protein